MIKKMRSLNEMPIGELKRVSDFLPPIEKIVFPKETVKVTLSLTKASLEFLKRQAKKRKVKYQKMIREMVDRYAEQYSSQ